MQWAVLKITDGTTTIDLLSGVIRLKEWFPAISEPKNGGVWRDSPLADGRQLAQYAMGNTIETINVALSAGSQEQVIRETQDLRRLLEQARAYWGATESGVPAEGPVWIEARSQHETGSRYAYIYDYRTPNDGDPYGAEFDPRSAPLVGFAKWTLLLERGHWQASQPGTYTCLPLANDQAGYILDTNRVANWSFETAGGGGADVFASWTETAGDGAVASEAGTVYHLTKSAKLTAGATANTTLVQAVNTEGSTTFLFSFHWYYNAATQAVPRYRIKDVTHGTMIINVTYSSTTLMVSGWTQTALYFTTPAGCLQVEITLYCPTGAGNIAYLDYVSLRKATPTTLGMTATCSRGPYGGNQSSRTQVTDIYAYDASAGTFGFNQMLMAPPFSIFPSPAAASDVVYFGVDAASPNNGPFTSLIFDLHQAAAGAAAQGVWECWTGAAWAAITNIRDNTAAGAGNHLDAEGVYSVIWKPQSGWTTTTVNNIFGWWVRFRLTGISGAPNPQQQNRRIYTANRPMLALASGAVGGDLPSLARHMIRGGGINGTFGMNRFVLFTRSQGRGASFDPYINLSDVQVPLGISFYGDVISSDMTFITSEHAPTGRAVRYSPAGVDTSYVGIMIGYPLCASYFGTYRAFLRVRQNGGAAGDFSAYLLVKSNARQTGPAAYYSDSSGLIELGMFRIPQKPLGAYARMYRFLLELHLACSSGAPGTLDLLDLVLVPVDECAAQIVNTSGFAAIGESNAADLDSITPGAMIAANDFDDVNLSPSYFANYSTIASGPLVLQPNEAQWIGCFWTDLAHPCLVWLDQAFHADRYFSMRGDR